MVLWRNVQSADSSINRATKDRSALRRWSCDRRPRRVAGCEAADRPAWCRSPVHAAIRADEMLDAGDLEGQAVWKAILKAVIELVSKQPEGTVH